MFLSSYHCSFFHYFKKLFWCHPVTWLIFSSTISLQDFIYLFILQTAGTSLRNKSYEICKAATCSVNKSKPTKYWSASAKLSLPIRHRKMAGGGFMVRKQQLLIHMGAISWTSPATLFTACVTAEVESMSPRWTFLEFDSNSYLSINIFLYLHPRPVIIIHTAWTEATALSPYLLWGN